jgi:predicted small metal-binding protein
MSYSIACGDVMEGCPVTATAETEDELLGAVASHAAADHGVTDITPDVLRAVRAAIRAS